MEKVLLYGNGYCLSINSFNNKEESKKTVEIFQENVWITEAISFDFSNEGIYDFLNLCIPSIFENITKDEFITKLKFTNLEDIFSEMYFNEFLRISKLNNDLDKYKNLKIKVDGTTIFPQTAYNKKWVYEINNFRTLIIFINYLMEIWIKKCYEILDSENSDSFIKIQGGHSDIPNWVKQFKKFNHYWTTNFSKDKIIFKDLNDENILYINGRFSNDSFDGIIFDGLISDNRNKKQLLEFDSTIDERKKMIVKNLKYISEFKSSRDYDNYLLEEYVFQIHLFGISPINDEALFEAVKKSNPSKIYYYYYQDDYDDELSDFNKNIKQKLDIIFGEYYFIPHNLFSSEIENMPEIENYKIEN